MFLEIKVSSLLTNESFLLTTENNISSTDTFLKFLSKIQLHCPMVPKQFRVPYSYFKNDIL